MKFYILSLNQNGTYFVANSFDQMIDWFARRNNGYYMGLGHWDKPGALDPRTHSYKDYNSALIDIAMNKSDVRWSGYYKYPVQDHVHEFVQRDIMVIDELNRVIDPRMYWDRIATHKVKYTHRKKKQKLFEYRFTPVPGIRRSRPHRGSYYRLPATIQERRASCDLELREYIKPKRHVRNLPNSWDDIPRTRNHCWKAKKLEKQWMKHI